MAEKEIMNPAEIGQGLLGPAAEEAYEFAFRNTNVDLDEKALPAFIAERNQKTDAFRELYEIQKKAERVSTSIKNLLKFVYGEGSEDQLPPNVRWAKQAYVYSFKEGGGAHVAYDLVKNGETNEAKLFDAVSVTAMAKAAGFTVEHLMEKYPGSISWKPKERSLFIK